MNLVILGGGFCGAWVAKLLDKHNMTAVTLVDKKPYFEYTPSIHKVLFNPERHKKIIMSYSYFLRNTHIITDDLLRVTSRFVETEKKRVYFDSLVISTGIDYPIFLENKKHVFTLKSGAEAATMSSKIQEAEDILIIGGGLIGTEIAGELVTRTKSKSITLVHSRDRLLERNPVRVSNYSKKFLEKRGVQIILNEKVVDHNDGTFVTDKGRIIKSDVAIWCAGIRSNPWFMKDFKGSIFTGQNSLKVNNHLQLEGYPNIFVGGDISSIREEKTARNAKRHASLIVKNLDRLTKKRQLIPYKKRSGLMVISLGDWVGIMTFRRFVITGLFPGILKRLIGWWTMRQLKCRR